MELNIIWFLFIESIQVRKDKKMEYIVEPNYDVIQFDSCSVDIDIGCAFDCTFGGMG